MNRTTRYIIAAFSAVVTLVSCAKEAVVEPEGSGLLPEEQLRGIAVSFEESTRTVLGTTIDGTYYKYRPAFCPGDRIKVSNATRSEDCVVADDGGVLKIFTNLEGALTAVYPASAANVTGTNPIPETDPWFKIPTTQTGKFSDANICTAAIAADGTAAGFVNQTALLRFYVDESIGVQKITITGTADIATGGGKTITVDPDGTALISSVTEEPDKRLCYVAILPGTNTLTFESVTTGQGQGTVSRTMKSGFNYTINKIYNAFIPYYINIKKKNSDEYMHWAYCNVGAFLPEEAGWYFACGYTEGCVRNSTDDGWVLASDRTTPKLFNSTDFPEKDPADYEDAATAYWGDGWRLPTLVEADSDFVNLINTCFPGTSTYEEYFSVTNATDEPVNQGVYYYKNEAAGITGFYVIDETGSKLFFPEAFVGYNSDFDMFKAGIYSAYSSNTKYCLGLMRNMGNLKFPDYYIGCGHPVRPIYDDRPGVINGGYGDAGSY